ncbi:uncharacterized protein LOC119871768 isoform X8 [Canis lupus familiaris]|uniref:uncharacterized protein LOC119871768 isoform X8 n=1 Tax=Canis lupus familiaris TaxID=9615 RepID=UPI0018F74AFD|nr:uncharacterized protein LOC119871768 isoform X8 [Canis lupus familiaris]
MTDTPIPPCARWVPLAREQACSSHTGMWSPSCSPRPPSGYSHITALRVGSLVALLLASGFNFDEVQSVAFCPWSCACGIQEKPSIPAPAPSPQGHSLAGPPTTISAPAWGWETSPPSISSGQTEGHLPTGSTRTHVSSEGSHAPSFLDVFGLQHDAGGPGDTAGLAKGQYRGPAPSGAPSRVSAGPVTVQGH